MRKTCRIGLFTTIFIFSSTKSNLKKNELFDTLLQKNNVKV